MVSSDSDVGDDSEVQEIRRAMREARLRKKSITCKIKGQLERDNEAKAEMEAILRTTTSKLDQTKKKLSESEFDLREARYELNQLSSSYNKLKEEKTQQENMHRREMQDIQEQLAAQSRLYSEKAHIISLECQKVAKLLENYNHTQNVVKRAEGVNMSKKHLLNKALATVTKVVSIAGVTEENDDIMIKHRKSSKSKQGVDTAVDNVMLDMCRNLEEENVSLINEVESLKEQLVTAKRESAASQLIPHYRLAIIRSRTYAAALQEQIEREKGTAQALREQLDETYRDLKKVVEDKRKLYSKLTDPSLQAQQDRYEQAVDRDVREVQGRGGSGLRGSRSSGLGGIGGEGGGSQQSREGRLVPGRSESPLFESAHRSAERASSVDRENEGRRRRGELERELQDEIQILDDQIESLKDKLSRAAVAQSQKILSEVIDSSLPDLKDLHLDDF